METSGIDVHFSLELDFGLPSILLQGRMVEIGPMNNDGGIKAFSNSLILSLKMTFFPFIYPIDIFRASYVAS